VNEVASGYDFETAEENHDDYCSAKVFVEGGARARARDEKVFF
jgi:hypothetical protein